MIWPNYLSVIFPAAFSTIHALHLPTPSNQTIGNSSKLASRWECTFAPLGIPPLFLDCTEAYVRLPRSHIRGRFHDAGEDDGYKLPVKRSHGTCALSVSLLEDGGQYDECSWAEIRFRAEVLADICVNGRNSGGYMKAGYNQRIKIEFKGVDVRNGTVVSGQLDVT